jgi:hypothetical protein
MSFTAISFSDLCYQAGNRTITLPFNEYLPQANGADHSKLSVDAGAFPHGFPEWSAFFTASAIALRFARDRVQASCLSRDRQWRGRSGS